MKISTTAITITSLFVSVSNAAAVSKEDEEEYAIDDLSSSWLSQLACTVDVAGEQPSLVADETICASTKDDSGQPCRWCDATSSIGSGVCVSSDQKSMMSTYWDQFCVASHSVDEPLQQQQLSLDEGDWLSQLACNVDISGQQTMMSNPKYLSPKFSHAIIDPTVANVFHASSWKESGQSMTCTSDANSRDGVQEQTVWISVDYDALPEVPMFFPIQRTSTVVHDCTDPNTIASRITDCLRKLSIMAEFNSSEPSLLAESLDHTMFFIRLYKKKNKAILVEIQRVAGDSFNFVKYARDIFTAARGEVVAERHVPVSNFIPTISKSSSCRTDAECREPPESDEECILHIEELLKNYRLDAVLLGIESLLILTDGEKSQVSSSMADIVVRGDSGRSIIKNFITGCIHSSPGMCLPPEENATLLDYEVRHSKNLHSTALAILANSLHALAADLVSSLLQSEEWMGQSGFIDVLLSELSQAEYQSHNAYHAARCLNTLLDSSFEMREVLRERGLSGVMKNSQGVGRRKHLLLAKECDAALAVLAEV